jgi:hypothetical protein
MRYLITKATLLSIAIMLLAGCSANRNIPLKADFWQNQAQKITVATVQAPKPQLCVIGAQGLLDMAITGIANNSLGSAIKNTDLSWYKEMQQNFVHRLKQSNMLATGYSGTLNDDVKAHASVLAETQGDLLLTLELIAIGARREYMLGCIPKGGPEGYCVLVGKLLNPNDKKVLWRHETEIIQKVQGKWDQPPHFPNFNTALNQATAEAKQEVLDSFFSGR